jgi:hypothetical protein
VLPWNRQNQEQGEAVMRQGGGDRRQGSVGVVSAAVLLVGTLSAWGIGGVAAQTPPGDPSLLQELAERLIAVPFASMPSQIAQPTIQLLPGQMPSDLPLSLPLPPGARLVGSVVRTLPTNSPDDARAIMGPFAPGATVVLDVPGSRESILALYEQALAQQGWSVAQGGNPFPGGFQTAFVGGGGVTYCRSESGPWFSVNVYPMASGTNDVRLTVGTNAGACSIPVPPMPRAAIPRAAELLPRLVPPPGVVMQPVGGGGGGSNRWSSEAAAETTRPAAELEVHFADQMRAAGWVRQTGGVAGWLAWSAWALPQEGDWQALLLVAEWPSPNRRWLSVRVESPSLAAEGIGGGGGITYMVPAGAPALPVGPPSSSPAPSAPVPTPAPQP